MFRYYIFIVDIILILLCMLEYSDARGSTIAHSTVHDIKKETREWIGIDINRYGNE